MPIKNPKDLFVTMLSQVRHGTERSAAIYKENLVPTPLVLQVSPRRNRGFVVGVGLPRLRRSGEKK
jgi:hypothetical protein